MSSVYSLWVNKMMQSRQEAKSLREKLSYSKQKQEKDPLMEYLISFRERMAHAKTLLTDPERTAFFFVTLPEALPIAVIKRFINWFHEFGIPVGGVVVNMRIDKTHIRDDVTDFVKNRIAMQDSYLHEIDQTFDGLVRAILPLFDDEVRGVPALGKTADLLLA
jgi:arsenite-transporting ATPase